MFFILRAEFIVSQDELEMFCRYETHNIFHGKMFFLLFLLFCQYSNIFNSYYPIPDEDRCKNTNHKYGETYTLFDIYKNILVLNFFRPTRYNNVTNITVITFRT